MISFKSQFKYSILFFLFCLTKTANATDKIPVRNYINDTSIQKGLFSVHTINERFFFEIPDSILNCDIAIITRVSKAPANHIANPFYSDDLIGYRIVRFSKDRTGYLLLKKMTFMDHSDDSSLNGMYYSVLRSNLQPITLQFSIEPFSSNGCSIINVTDLLNGNSDLLFFDASVKHKPDNFQIDKSFVEWVRCYSANVELRTVKSYAGATFELNTSFRFLDKKPMKLRYYDKRVGYYNISWTDFDKNDQETSTIEVIKRWRIQPKDEEEKNYQKGELVIPRKPIVFYIDPTMPQRWIPYVIQAVNDWQKAFEQAGFKDAIYALPVDRNDSNWNMQDSRYNVIVWKPTSDDNANGETLVDPKTGEILQARVNWNFNEMKWNRITYFILASPTDTNARSLRFKNEYLGQLIRSTIAHEIGHVLGLNHNFYASSTIPVTRLRDKKYVETNGFCPSIMDYARYNYVAQPEDSILEAGLMRQIGIYDKWAIEWGYRWFPDTIGVSAESDILAELTTKKLSQNKQLFYAEGLTEDLGDDPLLASAYGIKNLKRVMEKLHSISIVPDEINLVYQNIIDRYKRYLFHVLSTVASNDYIHNKSKFGKDSLVFPSRERQKLAIKFLDQHLFTTPLWLMDKNLLLNSSTMSFSMPGSLYAILQVQEEVLNSLLSVDKLESLEIFTIIQPKTGYSIQSFFRDIDQCVWKELEQHESIDVYRRNLQYDYVKQITTIVKELSVRTTDINLMLQQQMRNLVNSLSKAIPGYSGTDKLHLEQLKALLLKTINP